MLGTATVAKVNAQDIEAGLKRFVSRGDHVNRPSRALDAMPENDSRRFIWQWLPATVRQNFYSGLDFKQSSIIELREPLEAITSRPSVCAEGLGVSSGNYGMYFERFLIEGTGDLRKEFAYLGIAHRWPFQFV